MNKYLKLLFAFSLVAFAAACSDDDPVINDEEEKIYRDSRAEQNLLRAMAMVDTAIEGYCEDGSMKMSRYYNPFTDTASSEVASIWMYTASIEAVNAILEGLVAMKDKGSSSLYDQHYSRYVALLDEMYDGALFYTGTFELTSFTQTKSWTVYAVDRSDGVGGADVTGILNVYDDQECLVREFLVAYDVTGDSKYLQQAEYLTDYVLDGWDCTLDSNFDEHGGIPWGPGYTTKHSCSNGPMVSLLVWLHEHYKNSNEEITCRYIDTDNRRKTRTVKKSDYYLEFARKIYGWQKEKLMTADGVYNDMLGGGTGRIVYEEVDGVTYRAYTREESQAGPPISYNSGSMLSGAADLYRVTGESEYLTDLRELTDTSFSYFASYDADNDVYIYDITGFRNWYNGVLMRAFVDATPYYSGAAAGVESFQKNLDYGYDNFVYNNLLPTNLLVGWNRDSDKNDTECINLFALAAEYAVLAKYELDN